MAYRALRSGSQVIGDDGGCIPPLFPTRFPFPQPPTFPPYPRPIF